MSKTRFEKQKGSTISNGQIVQVKKMNHVVEIKCVHKKSVSLNKFRKISKTSYVDLESGEIGEYKLSADRSESTESLAHTFKCIRDKINCNFVGAKNELMHTLTYAENMTDTERLYRDFKAFWKRYRRRYGDNVDYMSIVEPQERGAWHMHLLVRHNDKKKIYIPNDELAELWGHGFTTTKAIQNVDNIGAYLSAYLANVELTPDNAMSYRKYEIEEKMVEGKTKYFVKGGRLKLYPPGMNIYRCSRGIVAPEIVEMTYKSAKKIVGEVDPNHSATVTIHDGDKLLNKISYEQYNLKRVASEATTTGTG